MTPLRLTADENMPKGIVLWLREMGCDVVWIRESARGSSDSDILRWATDESRVVITADKDFGELVHARRLRAAGVILIRLESTAVIDLIRRLAADWEELSAKAPGKFVIVAADRIRYRELPPPTA